MIEHRNLSKAQIDHVLGAEQEYELNPAHLTKKFEPLLNLPENRDFTELLRLWDAEGDFWTQPRSYRDLFNRLIDDERFVALLKERFPEAKPFFYENIETYPTKKTG